MNNKLTRLIPLELRAVGKKIFGMIPYGSESVDLGGFTEVLQPGCFRGSLERGDKIMSFWGHDDRKPLGNSKNGTLKVKDSPEGLRFEITPPDTSWAADALASISSGVINTCSFGMRVISDKWEGNNLRTVVDADLLEISPVSMAAYQSTSVSVRSKKLNLNDLYDERNRLTLQMREILETRGGSMPADIKEKYDRLEAQLDKLGDQIYAEEKLERLQMAEAGAQVRSEGFQADDSRRIRTNDNFGDLERRAFNKVLKGKALDNMERRALQADSDTAGGFAVPTYWQNEVIQERDRLVQIRQISRVLQMDYGDSLQAPRLDSDPADPNWTSELMIGAEDSSMDFELRSLTPRPLACYIKVSRDLIDSTKIDVAGLVKDRLAYKFAVKENSAYLTGLGAPNPLGVMTVSDLGISTDRDVTTGNTSTQIKSDGLIECKYHLEAQYRQNCRWIFHRDAVKMIRKLKDGEGNAPEHKE